MFDTSGLSAQGLGAPLPESLHDSFSTVRCELNSLYPTAAIIETDDADFRLERWLERTGAEYTWNGARRTYFDRETRQIGFPSLDNGHLTVSWEGARVNVVVATRTSPHGDELRRSFVVSEHRAIAESFFCAVCSAGATNPDDNVLVYDNGQWNSGGELRREIERTNEEDLVWPDGMREAVLGEAIRFFERGPSYREAGLAHRRGMLLVGPSGNGKSLTCRLVAKSVEVPFLYVRNFDRRGGEARQSVVDIFAKARRMAPCVLCFEDLDMILTERLKSTFLNELDGFSANEGILIIATSNHPQNLGSALLNRPARFDRKYRFYNPASADRRRYFEKASRRFGPLVGASLTDDEVARLVTQSDGFSFAHLSEIVTSAVGTTIGGDAVGFGTALENAARQMQEQIRFSEDVLTGRIDRPNGPSLGFLASARAQQEKD